MYFVRPGLSLVEQGRQIKYFWRDIYIHHISIYILEHMCFWFDKIHLIWFQIDKIWFHLVMSNKENWMEVKWLSKQESSTYMLEPEIWQKRKKIGGFFLLTEISSYFVLKQISSLFCWTLVVVGFNRSYLRHPPFTFSPKPKAKVWHKSWKEITYICIFVAYFRMLTESFNNLYGSVKR